MTQIRIRGPQGNSKTIDERVETPPNTIRNNKYYPYVQRYGEFINRYTKFFELVALACIGGHFKKGKVGYAMRMARIPIGCMTNLQKWLNYRYYVGATDDNCVQSALKRICPKFLCFAGFNGLALYGVEIASLLGYKLSPHLLSSWKQWGSRCGRVGTGLACALMFSGTWQGFYTARTYKADGKNLENRKNLAKELNKRRHNAFVQALDGVKYLGETVVPCAPTPECEFLLTLTSRLAAVAKSTYDVLRKDVFPPSHPTL